VSRETGGEQAYTPYVYFLSQEQEQGVVLSVRDLDRFIERARACRPNGWADLWLALAGAGSALAVGTLVAALTVAAAVAGVMWALTGAGAVVFALCLFGYLAQRRDLGREISELEKDLMLRRPGPPA
jgi:FtsH-binding integral membrane protein